jgi:cytochrome c oxidase subunit 2
MMRRWPAKGLRLKRGRPRAGTTSIGVAGALIVAAATTACAGPASMLHTAGPGAKRVEHFWWLLFGISAAVFFFVAAMLALAVVRRRRPSKGDPGREAEPQWGHRFILVSGVVVPAVILLATFGFTLHEMSALAKPLNRTRLTVAVIGHLWWWEARYPNGAVTANELHIPVGEAVRLELTTADVIHSFWVPQLQTKMDQIPGHTNEMWLQADVPGRYRGQCSQFCGLQHAHMIFYVVADTPADFQAWEAREVWACSRPTPAPAATPSAARPRWRRWGPTSRTWRTGRPWPPARSTTPRPTSPGGSPIPRA